jgi:hypothetical protein
LDAAAALLPLIALMAGCAPKPHVQLPAPEGGWVRAFNGTDLDGWSVKIAGHDLGDNYRNTFRVHDGVLAVSYDQYDSFGGRFGSLFYGRKMSHYWLRAEYRFVGRQAPGAPSWAWQNSGIQLHSQSPSTMTKAQQFPVSVEFDIVGRRMFGRYPTGDVCRNGSRMIIDGQELQKKCSRLSDVAIPGDQWVSVLAEVNGAAQVRQAVDGSVVVDYSDLRLDDHDPDARRLLAAGAPGALDSGYVSIQGNGHPIEFRRIDILPLDPPAP